MQITAEVKVSELIFSKFAEFRALLDEVLCGGSSVLLDQQVGEGREETERWPTPSPNDTLFRSTVSRFFCGQGRCDSPFGKE